MSVQAERLAGRAVVRDLAEGRVPDKRFQEMRTSIRRGDCALCGRSGVVSMGAHMVKVHELEFKAWRDLFFFTYKESICSPELSERRRDIALTEGYLPPAGTGKTGTKLSRRAVRKIQSAQKVAMEVLAAHPEKRHRLLEPRHGEGTGRSGGCTCELCRARNSEYMAPYRATAAAGRKRETKEITLLRDAINEIDKLACENTANGSVPLTDIEGVLNWLAHMLVKL